MKCFKKTLLFLLVGLPGTYAVVLAQDLPSWADYHGRQEQFPKQSFVVGYSSEAGISPSKADETLQRLSAYARQELMESIYVSIKSVGVLNINNINTKTHEEFRKSSVSYSNLNLSNLKTDSYYDRKGRTAYAIAYASKSGLVGTHLELISKNAGAITRKIATAEAFASQGDGQNAMKHYFEVLPAFREVESSYTLVVALAPSELAQAEALIKEVNNQKMKVSQQIAAYQQGFGLDLDGVAYFMAKGYDLQTRKPEYKVRLAPFTYRDTEMASGFSSQWQAVFEKKLIDVADFPVTREATKNLNYEGITAFEEAQEVPVRYEITGTFWEEGQVLKIISVLRYAHSGEAIASMEGNLPLAWFASNKVAFIPPQFEMAYSSLEAFTTDQPIRNDLVLDVWTNKGADPLIFSEGETMQVFIQTTKPCYVRLVYHTFNGEQVLLLDNFYISQRLVGKPYLIPETFVCTAPFGVETLQVNAQSIKFERLDTWHEDGYEYIAEGLDSTLFKARGFKKKENVLKDEKLISITTIPR